MSMTDSFILHFDQLLRTISPPKCRQTARETPAAKIDDCKLSNSERKHSAGLMRVNHSGEVCAQALYQGQALTAQLEQVRLQMAQAADEEIDHLGWCEQRLQELNAQPSVFNLLWYGLSFSLGAMAGLAGDQWSLGFVAETEYQVTEHLEKHLSLLAKQDLKTKAILEQMTLDEKQHAEQAVAAGGVPLPVPIKTTMRLVSKVMTTLSYYL